MDENLPETQPAGSLVPPPRVPPGALTASTPMSPRRSELRRPWRAQSVRSLADAAFDQIDALGDRIADLVGLR
jgi:hypothetical protein